MAIEGRRPDDIVRVKRIELDSAMPVGTADVVLIMVRL